jgi:hypothetical protein
VPSPARLLVSSFPVFVQKKLNNLLIANFACVFQAFFELLHLLFGIYHIFMFLIGILFAVVLKGEAKL